MRYHAIAIDFDGTLAHDGQALPEAISALEQLRATDRHLIIVTGRELPDLLRLLPRPELFDRIVAENGGLLYLPASGEERLLATPPPDELVARLRERGVHPLSVGRVVIAAWEPHQEVVLDSIRTLGLEHHIIFNKGAVMVLPPGVSKGSGLAAALRDLGLSPHNAVAVGDAENDHAMFDLAERSVAVMNALPAVKRHADIITNGDHGWGVIEVVHRLLQDDLASYGPSPARHQVLLGEQEDGEDIHIPPPEQTILIVGPPQSGKTTIAVGLLERLMQRGYQCCVIDPEGDYECLPGAISIGDATQPPLIAEIMQILDHPDQNVVVTMLGVPYDDRPDFYGSLIDQLDELGRLSGRPHWLIVDEAHHLLPRYLDQPEIPLPRGIGGSILITVNPSHLAKDALGTIDLVIATGPDRQKILSQVANAMGDDPPEALPCESCERMTHVWRRHDEKVATPMIVVPPEVKHRRHRRKYAQGDLGGERSFYFRGADALCNLRAANLVEFMQIADQLDDETWRYHLDRGDYSRWLGEVVRDPELAYEARYLEGRSDLPVPERRARLRRTIEAAYTLPV